ncbi:MAG: DUF4292 domain-containing protein [Hydrotalea flava]|uniref:DUF4292 domain-containing protein n=1 Tax=Hydrotalea flava TaxID=714549 RepID=UPI000831FF75|nr:DUF4292 domain-containing protein [Hydrotalea flava]RTL48539.1 MAG: DUF4292 domain-containing protein [Sphingobacteriales bacterium]NIM35844.1 DUF4292 domain-containing protein [Hydrotalea flava]NIM38696.1 DUF4292 domain-containing protein [Hydrotalea flava]NIN03884.1 DUF4292 domain-containing protein [Hydrotalea flava]NIN15605.1 DUF4292 domain-containing protein [Hydrotalea flava]
MMQRIIVFSLLALTVWACHPVKKVQSIEKAISKKDTAQIVIVTEAPKVDSAAIVKEIMEKVMKHSIDFNTFNAKVKVDYEGPEESQHVNAYLSMIKDSVIYVKMAIPPYGVVANVLVTPDSVILIRLKGGKSIQYRSIAYLQEVTQIPFDFSTLQDLIVGNPVFLDSNVVSYKSGNKQLLVLMVGNMFKHLVTLDNTDFRVLHSKLDDVDIQRNRTCDITFSNYQPVNNFLFATFRQISVAEKSKLDIFLDFKEFSFNEPLKYTFSVPKNYRVK